MKISVITVAFNAAKTIANTLESVAEQEYFDVEHIVIDGASTDETKSVVLANDGRVSTFVSEPDQGIYDAMNKGIALASGDVIGFLNADDVYAHTRVLTDIAALHETQPIDACYADLIYVRSHQSANAARYWRSQPHRDGLCFQGWMPAHPTLYVKRNVFEQVGVFDHRLGNQADLEFCARAFEIAKIRSHYESQVWVHMLTGGASQNSIATMIKSNWVSYLALKRLGMKRNPVSFFAQKFAAKLPQFFYRQPSQNR